MAGEVTQIFNSIYSWLNKSSETSEDKKNVALETIESALSTAKDVFVQGLDKLAKETGWNVIEKGSESDHLFNQSEGTALVLRTQSATYNEDDPLVQKYELRKACTQALKAGQENSKVVWSQSAGVFDPGSIGIALAVPVVPSPGPSLGINFGFSAGALARYRCIMPHLVSSNVEQDAVLEQAKVSIPTCSDDAKKMPQGYEIEFGGQGKARGWAGISAALGLPIGAGNLGVTARANVQGAMVGEFSVNVISLDGKGKVRVLVRRLDEEQSKNYSRLNLGLWLPPGAVIPVISAFGGQLRALSERGGYNSLEAFISAFTSAQAGISELDSIKHVALQCFDFDLNDSKAATAFNSLLHLSLSEANQLANDPSSKVKRLNASESEKDVTDQLDVSLLNQKLLLSSSLNSEKKGTLKGENGTDFIYRDKLFKKTFGSWFTGNQEIEWQFVYVLDKKTNKQEPFFRLHYKNQDLVTMPETIERQLAFAKAIGAKPKEPSKNNLSGLSMLEKAVYHNDETNTEVDIYFTKQGIKNILSTSYKELKNSYLNAATLMDSKDENADHNAHKFAKTVILSRKSSDSLSQLFKKLGEEHGFDYMTTVLALSQVAKRQETLIHRLSIEGAVQLVCEDEGLEIGPRDLVAERLYSLS